MESNKAGIVSVAEFDEVKKKMELVESRLASKSDLIQKKQAALAQQFAQCQAIVQRLTKKVERIDKDRQDLHLTSLGKSTEPSLAISKMNSTLHQCQSLSALLQTPEISSNTLELGRDKSTENQRDARVGSAQWKHKFEQTEANFKYRNPSAEKGLHTRTVSALGRANTSQERDRDIKLSKSQTSLAQQIETQTPMRLIEARIAKNNSKKSIRQSHYI